MSDSLGEVMKSTTTEGDAQVVPEQELSRLKRTFTLSRNPLTRISKRKPKVRQEQQQQQQHQVQHDDLLANRLPEKKVFRRPSFRKFLTRIAQHIGNVPINGTGGENRVPPVGLQTWGPDDTPGVTGLRNHGNTCFINAVLQCISHTDVLAEYFVLDKYKIDLSRRNKLNSKKHGTKGEVTEQLAVLLKALWACQYNPDFSTTFKQVVERYGAQYKGTQQHDALEFLVWLLDKVHEDLNMAPKKKYKSIKTLNRPDEVIAAETLENYRRRDNSFIHSVFQAQYRSSLSCPRCLTQSNTFDPFQCISVQLPQLYRHSIYVTVLYTSQQPREVKIGLSLQSGATVSELRDLLQSDTSIARSDMLLTEIGEHGFLRTFTDAQPISVISEADPVYCIEVPQLKDATQTDSSDEDAEETQSAYVLLCWINVVETAAATTEETRNDDTGDANGTFVRFGSPYVMQVNRETSYEDLQKLMLKEMAPILHDDVLTAAQENGVFKMRISDPAYNFNEPAAYLEPALEHPLFMEAVDQALALCSEDGGPAHLKLVLEWTRQTKEELIADDLEDVEEHSSVKQLKAQALQGGAPLTLEECLRHYTKAETLDDAWRCPQCQQYQPVVKTLDMWSLPEILVVHFKRFRQQTVKGRNSTKLTTMVDFPVVGFDMTPHLANKHGSGQLVGAEQSPVILHNGGGGGNWSPWKRSTGGGVVNGGGGGPKTYANDNIYDLYAVCYHHGTDLETGHYTAACKNPYDSNWYLYDDAKVSSVLQASGEEGGGDIAAELVNNSAYILFYQKRNGIYGANSNSSGSSAASTSSVGSGGDHWVNRMPKFVPPKGTAPLNKEPTVNNNNSSNNNNNNNNKQKQEAVAKDEVDHDEVLLRNSQNMLLNNGSGVAKSEEEAAKEEQQRKCKSLVVESCDVAKNSNNEKARLSWISPQVMRKTHESSHVTM